MFAQGFLLEDSLASDFERRKNGFILEIQAVLKGAKIEQYTYAQNVLTLYFKKTEESKN